MSTAAVLWMLAACAPPAPQLTPSAPPGTDAVETVVQGLDAPWSIVFHDGTPLVSERDTARVLEVLDDGTTREIAMIDGVAPGGEGGLLGLACTTASCTRTSPRRRRTASSGARFTVRRERSPSVRR